MLRAAKTIAAVMMMTAATTVAIPSFGFASELSDAYNNQTDRNFRIGMQMRLAWTGDYAGAFSGTVDAASLRAIRDFQARHGMEASGVIDEAFLKELVARSDAALQSVGFQTVDDPTTGARIALPLGLVADAGRTPIGNVWRSADGGIEVETARLTGADQTLDGIHASLSQPTATRTVTSDERLDDGFVVAGVESGRNYVMRFKGVDGDVRGFGVSYAAPAPTALASYATVATNLFDPALPEDGAGAAVAVAEPSTRHRLSAIFNASAPPESGESPADKPESSGSGFVVSSDGWVLTNAHVAASCQKVMVGDRGLADKVIVDEANDLAVLHVGAKLGKPLPIASGAPRLGEDVLALGFPLRSILADSLNVTRGNVSSLLGLQNDPRYLQISAPVQPGNSGGPLVDLTGRVVGVVTAKLDALAVADATGDIPQSINFAVRPDAVASFLKTQGIDFRTASASKAFNSVADTTEGVQDSVLPVLCLGEGSH